ncbi:hypothetical protein PSP6_310038 [Paraburkholderia tropica]|nr:hypothetical protein PSP6_310038 [Paraburkholderia tropica]
MAREPRRIRAQTDKRFHTSLSIEAPRFAFIVAG